MEVEGIEAPGKESCKRRERTYLGMGVGLAGVMVRQRRTDPYPLQVSGCVVSQVMADTSIGLNKHSYA